MPDNAGILDTRGRIVFALGRIDAALSDLDMAITKGFNNAGTYYARGRCHQLKDNKEAAVADYRKALELTATDDYAKHAQTQAHQRMAELGALPAQQNRFPSEPR